MKRKGKKRKQLKRGGTGKGETVVEEGEKKLPIYHVNHLPRDIYIIFVLEI